jgi:cytochrome c-type biogenesis protein CcmH
MSRPPRDTERTKRSAHDIARVGRSPRGRAGLLTALATVLLLAPAPTSAPAAAARTNLPAVESQVMCVTCKIPLTVAQSPQADRERAFIQELIGQGESEAQIKQALVDQYGPQVLALPATHGFDLAAYLVPIVGVAFVLGLLLLLLPRWRQRGRTQPVLASGVAGESAADLGESAADLGESAADLSESAADLGESAADVDESAADMRAREEQALSPADAARLEADLARFD